MPKTVAPAEQQIWTKEQSGSGRRRKRSKVDDQDRELERKYDELERRVVTEVNRERLPLFVSAIKESKNIIMRPVYQRRSRWNTKKQSKLIESFIMNIPVPPIYLYEIEANRYEIVDGQQRVQAIVDFYDKRLKLIGLTKWPELNGRTYDTLPPRLKAGIDRRTISSIVMLYESARNPEEGQLLQMEVFARLNTGGVELNQQEIRNCLYQGRFNNLLRSLSCNPIFTKAWNIPDHKDDNEEQMQARQLKKLRKDAKYKSMEDAELVLRFFALRHYENLHRSLKSFLDIYMIRTAKSFSEVDEKVLRGIFESSLELAHAIYGDQLFRVYLDSTWSKRPYRETFDAVMVGISQHLDQKAELIQRRQAVVDATKKLLTDDAGGLYRGKGKKIAHIKERIRNYDAILVKVLTE